MRARQFSLKASDASTALPSICPGSQLTIVSVSRGTSSIFTGCTGSSLNFVRSLILTAYMFSHQKRLVFASWVEGQEEVVYQPLFSSPVVASHLYTVWDIMIVLQQDR
jgi:hypothetical protein